MAFSRRSFLRGTAGAIIALPFLEAMPIVRADGAAPKRFVVFNRPWGTIPSHWTPDGVGSDFTLREIMEPLAVIKARGKLGVITGVSMESAQQQYAGLGSHPVGENHALTAGFQRNEDFRCIEWRPCPDRDAQCDTEIEIGTYSECHGNLDIFGSPGRQSIDSAIAEQIWGGTRLKHLTVGRASGNSLSVDAMGNRIPVVESLDSLFETLFADGSTSDPGFESARRRRASILDHARTDMERLRTRVSSSDRERLESHYTAIREVEESLDAARRECTVPGRPTGDALRFEGERWIENMQTAHRLIAMALSCDITRTVSIFWHTDGVPLDTLRSLDARIHADPHGEGSHAFPGDTARIGNAVALHKQFIGLFAHLAEQLDDEARPEADGTTVLDSAALLHTSDMATGLHSFDAGVGAWNMREGNQYARGMPYLYAGSAGGALRTNEHFVLDDPSDYRGRYSHGELFLTMARAMGIGPDRMASFGEEAFCHGEIPELLA